MAFSLPERSKTIGASFIRNVFERGAGVEGFISFGIGNPASEVIPVKAIQEAFDHIVHHEAIAILQYGPMSGDAKLAALTTQRLVEKFNLPSKDQSILISIGAGQDLGLVARTVLNEGDEVYVDAYTFTNGINAVRNVGGVAKGIAMDEYGMIPEALEAAAQSGKGKYIYLIPNFQNPTGITMPLERRQAIYQIASKYDLFIYEDDPYGEIRFAGERIPTLKEMDTDNRVLYAGSYSKTISAGLRVGFLYGPTEVINAIQSIKNNCDGQMPLVTQKVVTYLLENYSYDDIIDHVKRVYKEKCDAMVETFHQYGSQKVHITEPEGGMFVWMTLPEGVDCDAFFEAAISRKVGIIPCMAFTADGVEAGPHFRLSYTVPSVDEIKRGMQIIGELTREFCD